MMMPRDRMRRFGRARPTKTARQLTLSDLLRDLPPLPMALAEQARREAEAAGEAAPLAPSSESGGVTAPAADAAPVAPTTPVPQTPPPEPVWWEEKLGWRSSGVPEPYVDDVRYETIHKYDPLERAARELDYDWDD